MFSRVDWDLTQNTMSGLWVELDYGVHGGSSTPRSIKDNSKRADASTVPRSGETPNRRTNNAPGFVSNPPPTVLAPIAYNALDSEILRPI